MDTTMDTTMDIPALRVLSNPSVTSPLSYGSPKYH